MAVKKWRGKWVADLVDEGGRRIRRVSPVQTKAGATEYERQLLRASEGSSSISMRSSVEGEPRKEVPRLEVFAVEWLKVYVTTNNKPSEVVNKESMLRVHLIPFCGNRKLDEITARDIETYKATKRETGLSAKTVNNHLTVLRKLLVTAMEWEIIDRLPVVKKLKVAPAKFDWLTREESTRFLAAIKQHYPAWNAVFTLALRTGMRRGEIFALQWDDVDLVARIATVRHTVFRGSLLPPKGGRERAIPMTAELTAVLKAHRAATRLRSSYLFPNADGKLTEFQDHVDAPLHGALKRAGLRRVRFHDLRHSFASQLVSAGRSVKEVQELLGHESLQMTMRYAHLAPGRMRDAVAVLDDVVSPDFGTNLEQETKKGPELAFRTLSKSS